MPTIEEREQPMPEWAEPKMDKEKNDELVKRVDGLCDRLRDLGCDSTPDTLEARKGLVEQFLTNTPAKVRVELPVTPEGLSDEP